MKKLLSVLIVLAIASIANAGLCISVNGVCDPPDTSITLMPSQTAVIDICVLGDPVSQPRVLYLFVQNLYEGGTGGGTLDEDNAIVNYHPESSGAYPGDPDVDYPWIADNGYPWPCDVVYIELVHLAPPPQDAITGTPIDNIIFHCEGLGDVKLWLTDVDDPTIVYDTQIIHQVPEPASMLLLGLGGLLLRRRK